MEFSRNLFNNGLEPLHVTPTSKRCEAFADCDIQSSDKAFMAWMASEIVLAFIRSIPGITTYSEAHELYSRHMERQGSFESHARGTRKAAEMLRNGEVETPEKDLDKVRRRTSSPKWYDAYRGTNHWSQVRGEAHAYYDSCVLCGLKDHTLQTHHRHYNTMGREQMNHVSLLCDEHHGKVHPMLGLKCPKEIPQGVLDVFEAEGIDWRKI